MFLSAQKERKSILIKNEIKHKNHYFIFQQQVKMLKLEYTDVYFGKSRVWSTNPAVRPHLDSLVKAPKFIHWVNNFQFRLESIQITDIDMFGSNVGFYKGKAEAYDEKGGVIHSNIFFNRGGSTAILFIVKTLINGVEETLVPIAEQVRLPVGKRLGELPAGMKDGETGQVKGPIIKEIREEIPIGDLAENDPRIFSLGAPIIPSGGGCDEAIDLWCMEIDISHEKYLELISETFGNKQEHEEIKIKFLRYEDLLQEAPRLEDAKLLSALYRYECLLKRRNHYEKAVLQSSKLLFFASFVLVLTCCFVYFM